MIKKSETTEDRVDKLRSFQLWKFFYFGVAIDGSAVLGLGYI